MRCLYLLRFLAAVLLMSTGTARESQACKYVASLILQTFHTPPVQCQHALCGQTHATHVQPLSAYPDNGSSCSPGDFRAMDGGRPMLELEARGGILLIGETHDNPDHHRLRARVLSGPGREMRGSPRAVIFEHIRTDQQSALDQFNAAAAASSQPPAAADLLKALEWDKSGWPKAAIFEPLFAAALDAKLPILPGDPPRGKARAVAMEGLSALDPAEAARLKLDTPLTAADQDQLLTELEDSHCGLMPKTAFGNMAVAQRYRDAHLAAQLAAAYRQHGTAVLLAGNGHVRTDRGVPYYLRQILPGVPIVSVMLIEVEDGKTDPAAYVPRDTDGKPAADYLVFTPRTERPDPCIEMRARFGKKG
jgi:uncharacterized iron-regulated protein